MNLPDRIFALGGAGKAITYELLDTDWVQEEILEPQPDPRSLTVTIVDTAEEEVNRDLEQIHELEDKISNKKDELRKKQEDTSRGRLGDIDIEYLPLTKEIQLHDQNDLVGEEAVPRITSGNGMEEDNWWLKPEYINENLDFATGVVRKRGLGKALYYKSYAEDDDVRTSIDLPSKGKVAVIAGLGGGSGSGIFIDLVRDLKQTNRTAEMTLFGVLPNDEEGDAETANAHAALSELEHISLNDEDIFKDLILIPIDPTGFGGKRSNILQSSEELVEFDQAVTYLIASYYNMMDMEDPFNDIPSYAPFIIGIPQIARYNVDQIQDAKAFVDDILSAKERAIEAQSDIYDGVERFLSKRWASGEPDGELHDADLTDLESRLDEIKSLLNFDLFEELNYESVSIYKDVISQAESESDEIVDQIGVIGGSIRAGTTQLRGDSDQFVDSTDKQLGDVVQAGLERITQRKEILRKLRGIEDTQIQTTISYLIGLEADNVNPGVRLNQLETKLEEAEDRKDRLESDLEKAEQELKNKRQQRKEQVSQEVSNWERTARPIYDDYMSAKSVPVNAITDDLSVALDTYAREIEDAETMDVVEAVNESQVQSAVNELSNEIEKVGVNTSNIKQNINSSLRDLQTVKTSFIKMNAEEGLLESVIPWETSAEEERDDAKRNYKMKKTKLEDKGIFSISRTGDSLSIESTFDGTNLVTTIEQEVDQRKQEMLTEARAILDEEHPAKFDEIRSKIDNGASFGAITDIIEELVRDELINDEGIEEQRNELEQDLETAKDRINRYEDTTDLFEELNKIREKLLDAEDEYREHQAEYQEDQRTNVSAGDDSYGYIKTMQPNNILQIREDNNIEKSNLLDDQTERQRLRSSLEELASKAQQPQYTGIKRRRISNKRSRYTDMNVVVGVLSQAINDIGDIADLEDEFQKSYHLGSGGKKFASFPVESGGNWDVALGMFIGGVFLDNLRAEVAADGYHAGYEAKKESEDTDILVHHNHKLDEGWFVSRDKLLNMENQDDVDFFLRDEKDIINDLTNQYQEITDISNSDNTEETESGGE